MKNLFLVLLTSLILLSPVQAAPQAAQQTAPAKMVLPLAKKKWTMIVYINTKNNIGDMGSDLVKQFAPYGSTDNTNIVGQAGIADVDKQYNVLGYLPVFRFYTVQNAQPVQLDERRKVDMGDWKELASFIRYAKTNFPADKYMLLLFGHGSGWGSSNFGKQVQGSAPKSNEAIGRAVLFDDQTGNHVTTLELRAALQAAGGVDVLNFYSCLMADLGVTAEIGKYVKYIAGSEANFKGPMNFKPLLTQFNSRPDMSEREAAELFVDTYLLPFNAGKYNADITASVVDATQVPELATALKAFVTATLKTPSMVPLAKAYTNCTRLTDMQQADLYDFARRVAADSNDASVTAAAENLMRSIDTAVKKNLTFGVYNDRVHGISIYMPLEWYDEDYENLMLDKYTGWSKLIQNILPVARKLRK